LSIGFIIIAIGLLSIFFFVLSAMNPGTKKSEESPNSISWVKFFSKGKEAGFATHEIKLLQDLAKRSNSQNPAALFWSQSAMDECIKSFIQDLRAQKTINMPENQEFLSRLFEFRKKMEMDRPRYKNGISSSRQLSELQMVQVVVQDAGIFKSKVVSFNSQTITILRPDSSVLKANFKWQGQHVLIYFWRKDDAGYCFESDVASEVFGEGAPVLKLTHSEKLLRTQNRKNLRVKTHRAANIYTLGDDNNDTAVVPGVKCFLEDISDTGCAVSIRGVTEAGLRVIVQFSLDNMPLNISGMVRSIEYNKEKDSSLLHIESDLIPTEVKNMILGMMFGAIVDDFDTIPLNAALEKNAGQGDTVEDAGGQTGEKFETITDHPIAEINQSKSKVTVARPGQDIHVLPPEEFDWNK
jgi:c-di-GMP-binding flagellar brake protein YcgR